MTVLPALGGWHPGEKAVQRLIRLPQMIDFDYVDDSIPVQHRVLYSHKLYFLAVTTLDELGRPWASILTGKTGRPGFMDSPDENTLIIQSRLWKGDPILENLSRSKNTLICAVGIDTTDRTRTKFTGSMLQATVDNGNDLLLRMHVSRDMGLCPKYITVRSLAPHENKPSIVCQELNMKDDDRLPTSVIDFIHSAETAYLGTYYHAAAKDEARFPSHLGTAHRGGRAGFTRVRPSDGRTLVLPDYAGNRTMMSLGNIHVTPLASMVFPNFSNGSVLYVTGEARTIWGDAVQNLMPGANNVTVIRATGYSLVENALPFRETSRPSPSPYNPSLLYLAEETPPEPDYSSGGTSALLTHVRVHNSSLTTLTFRADRPLIKDMKPGGNVVLDLSEFIRELSHELIDWTEDSSRANDDCIRTWTVSIPPTDQSPDTFSITMRAVLGGLVTPVLYEFANAAAQGSMRNINVSSLNITVPIRGIGAGLEAPQPIPQCSDRKKLLWVAGGIGITPFLGFTRYVAQLVKLKIGVWDVVLVLSTREPDVMLSLVAEALAELRGAGVPAPNNLKLAIHLFTPTSPLILSSSPSLPRFVEVHTHQGRIDEDVFRTVHAKDREPYMCGPLPFMDACKSQLVAVGVRPEDVRREDFNY